MEPVSNTSQMILSSITWQQFAVSITILLILYYSYLGWKYYPDHLSILYHQILKKINPQKQQAADELDDATVEQLETAAADLRYAVLDKAGKSASKKELILQLQNKLASYTGLQKPAFRVAINNFLRVNAKEINGVLLSEEELNAVWSVTDGEDTRHQWDG